MYDIAAKVEETKKQQADLLFGLIHVGPKLLWRFISSTREDLEFLRSLCKDVLETQDYQNLVTPAFRLTHTIKGNAALFDLTLFKHYAGDLENEITQYQHQGNDADVKWVQNILDRIAIMEEILKETDYLLEELTAIQHTDDSEFSRTQALLTTIRQLVEQLARNSDKQVTLRSQGFDLSQLPADSYDDVVEVVTQLVNNAVVHGIEKPKQRQLLGKFPIGMVWLQSDVLDDSVRIRVQDDGAGPNFELIRKLATQCTEYSQQQLEDMSNAQIANLMFVPGLTTVNKANDMAGRGIGMDMIRQKLEDINAELRMRFSSGEGCQFDIVVPLVK